MLPTFRTERLLVRPRSVEDLDDCLAMDREPLVTRYIAGPWSNPDEHLAFVMDRMQTTYPHGLGYWSVMDTETDLGFMGWVLLLPCSGEEYEIGWRFRRECWGQGYATEAALPVLRHAFETVGLPSVVADIHPHNIGSINVAEKLGLRFVENRVCEGEPAVHYQIDADVRQSDNPLQT